MLKADETLDGLANQVVEIEKEIFSEDGNTQIEVYDLLKSVTEVTSNYENLRKEITEVQDLQKQLSSTLQNQLKVMQSKFNTLKEKLYVNELQNNSTNVSRIHIEEACSMSRNVNHLEDDDDDDYDDDTDTNY